MWENRLQTHFCAHRHPSGVESSIPLATDLSTYQPSFLSEITGLIRLGTALSWPNTKALAISVFSVFIRQRRPKPVPTEPPLIGRLRTGFRTAVGACWASRSGCIVPEFARPRGVVETHFGFCFPGNVNGSLPLTVFKQVRAISCLSVMPA